MELFLVLVLLGDFEVDFLDGRGEFGGLIELCNSLYCFLANRLCACIFIKIFKPSALTTLASTRPALTFLAEDLDLVLEGVAVLTVVKWDVVFDEDDCGTAEPGVLSPAVPLLQLDPHELPRKSLPALGSQSFGTFGGADGRGVIRRGEEVLVKTSVG